MAALIPASHLDLFEKKAFAYLATHLQDDAMLVNPVWCDYDARPHQFGTRPVERSYDAAQPLRDTVRS